MFNSIISSHKNLKTRKKTSSRQKNREKTSPGASSKFRNTFLSQYDYNSPTTASGSTNSGPATTTNALQKLLCDQKVHAHNDENLNTDPSFINNLLNSKISDLNGVNINSCNGQPLMIKIGNESEPMADYDYIRKSSKTPVNIDTHGNMFKFMDSQNYPQSNAFHQKSPFDQQLLLLKTKFKTVLENYRKREEALIQRCKYLEAELLKSRESRIEE